MQGLAIGARERLDGGKLSLYVAQRPGRLGLLRFALRALCGRLAQERDFDVMLSDQLDIETRHRAPAGGHRWRSHHHDDTAALPDPCRPR